MWEKTSMKRISIPLMKCQSLGHTIYRGSVKAKELYPALWIDRYDEDVNPYGYQRPFEMERSKDAAKYAEDEPRGFWPECVLNVRANDDASKTTDVLYSFAPISPGSPYGVFTVDYDETKVKQFGAEQIPWERAFSEVDCQHRLGMMASSEKEVTVCIFERLTRLEEALIFRVINEKQKKISTSLVDLLLFHLGKGKLYKPTLAWAMQLDSDPLSPFYQKVYKGGAKLGRTYVVSLRTLHECMKLTLGDDEIPEQISGKQQISILKKRQNSVIYQTILNPDVTETQKKKNFDKAYEYIRTYWKAISDLWKSEWDPSKYKQYKLLTTPGLKGFSMVGSIIFEICRQKDNYSYHLIDTLLSPAVGWVSWDKDNGDFVGATGNAGAVIVRETLRQKIVPVGVL
jgi:DGQHR domain-containing protein